MSVVLSYTDNQIAVIASDGRVVDQRGNIVSENCNKTMKLNNQVIVGFAGNHGVCENIINLLTQPNKQPILQTLYVDDIVPVLSRLLNTIPQNELAGFLVSGIARNGKICTSTVINHQSSTIEFPTKESPIAFGLYPQMKNQEDILKLYLKQDYPNYEKAIRKTILYCSKNSKTVNQNIYFEHVLLKSV